MEKIDLNNITVQVTDNSALSIKRGLNAPQIMTLERCMRGAVTNYINFSEWKRDHEISVIAEADNEFLLEAYEQRKAEITDIERQARYETYLKLKKVFENNEIDG